MGKSKRYFNRFEMYLSSEKGKRMLNYGYSIGASVVVIGAMFKIVRLPFANEILCTSLIIEAIVFFISAFERPGNEYSWEDVFPVLKSKNPLDRPDFSSEGSGISGGINISGAVIGGGDMVGTSEGGGFAGGGFSGGGGYAGGGGGYVAPPVSAEERVSAGMSAMGLNISEEDSDVFAESIKKLNSAAEQISRMADLTEATQTYIDRISTVSQNLDKFSEITSSLGEVSDSIISSCKVISGYDEEGTEEKPKSYVEQMTMLNGNISELNKFYETQFAGLHSQMETVHHINAGLNRIRDLYDSSLVDSAAFRNENERMAQLLAQLNQVYTRMLQAMTVNMPGGAVYAPPAQPGYQQPPYPQGGYPTPGGYR
jgi:gliding motility-associated protein GldL